LSKGIKSSDEIKMRVRDIKKNLAMYLSHDAAMNKRADSRRGTELVGDLGEGQVKTLFYLWINNMGPKSKGVRTVNISQATGYGPAVVHNFYTGLQRRGLITRTKLPGERGQAYGVRLTKRGMDRAKEIASYFSELAGVVEKESFSF